MHIRGYEDRDRNNAETLILELKPNNPNIEDWLSKKMDKIVNREDVCVVAIIDNEVAGVSVSSEKTPGIISCIINELG